VAEVKYLTAGIKYLTAGIRNENCMHEAIKNKLKFGILATV
jgi:hypothetical protein